MRQYRFGACLLLAACSVDGFDYEDAVKAELRDPDSAQFSDVVSEAGVACGFVNAKNGYGGFSGKMAFVVTGSEAIAPDVHLIDAPDEEDGKLIKSRCPAANKDQLYLWTLEKRGDAIRAWVDENAKILGTEAK